MKRYRFLSIVLAAVLLAALVAACGGVSASRVPNDEGTASPIQSDERYEGTAVPTLQAETEERTMTPEATEAKLPSEAEEVVQLAREDLGQRLDLGPQAIGLVSVEAVDWPDTSLGCPQPGIMYAQVITPGFRLVLEAEGQVYRYHTDARGFVVLCAQRSLATVPKPAAIATPSAGELPDVFLIYGIRPPAEATPSALRSPEQYENDVIEAVTADLAKRLGVPVEAIRVAISGYGEVQVVSPCGGVRVEGEEGPLGGGLALGYEVILEEAGTQHRYVALGGLAYYCGAQ